MLVLIYGPLGLLANGGLRMQLMSSNDILLSHWMVPMSEEQQQKRECLMQTIDRINRPAYGTKLSTLRHGEVELKPTERNVLLVEAGCGAQKTRTLLAWVKEVLRTNPDMPILFIISRITCRSSWQLLKRS